MSTKRALAWSYVGTATKVFTQFMLTVTLARVLGPEPYGLMAVALLPISFGALIADAGFGSGLIQQPTIDRLLIAQCQWWQTVIGLGMGLLVIMAAMPLTHALGSDGALPYMLAVAAIFPINAASQVSGALLRRDMRFKEQQIATVTGMLIGNAGIGLPLALLGAGAWSLVAAVLAQSLINALIVCWYVPPQWAWRYQQWPATISRFGVSVIGLNLANWTITNVEAIFLSRFQGPQALGNYNRLTVISTGLVGMLIPPLQGVLLAHHSRQQHDIGLIRRQWMFTVLASAALFGLMALPLLLEPELVIAWTLGPRWLEYAPVLQILALAMIVNAMMSVSGPVLQAVGRPGCEFAVQAAVALAAVPLLAWTASMQGIELFAWAVASIAVIRGGAILLVTAYVLRLFSKVQTTAEGA